ncbi:MAG: Gfo/Idh/MocA family oxidoreductase [Elusimicrobia bacterium]|nr:Gfo/Idh/MocA family oxidoreductase [Elusimicrobiota bacterium]
MTLPLKTAIVGMGPQGRRMLKAVQRLPAFALVGVADTRPDCLEKLELPAGCSRSPSAEELLDRHRDVSVVLVTTTAPSHAPLALLAIERGARYVLVEKPMACSVEECLRIEEAARAKGVRLCVNHSTRHDPLHDWIRKEIATGRWGAVRSVYVQRPGIGLGCVGGHSIDQINNLVGRPVETVTGWIDAPKRKNPRGDQFCDPGGLLILDYGGETRGIVVQNEDGAGPISIEINLQRARIRVDEKLGECQILERDQSVVQGPNQPAAYIAAPPPASLPVRQDLSLLLDLALRELVAESPCRCTAAVGRDVLQILTAGYLSARSGHLPVRPGDLTESQKRLTLAVT